MKNKGKIRRKIRRKIRTLTIETATDSHHHLKKSDGSD
jgi:hypothetical protein